VLQAVTVWKMLQVGFYAVEVLVCAAFAVVKTEIGHL
jgi:hypothetical protein